MKIDADDPFNPGDRANTPDDADDAMAAQILAHIAATYLESDHHDFELGLDTELIALNLLDSFSVLDLVTYLHSEHGAQISIEAIRLENFATIRKICRLVHATRERREVMTSTQEGLL